MKYEVKPHTWREKGECFHSDFFVFVDDKPRLDLSNCAKCSYFNGKYACSMAKLAEDDDDKIYPFCGVVCGYFDLVAEGTNDE